MKTLINTNPLLYKIAISYVEDTKFSVLVINKNEEGIETILHGVSKPESELVASAFSSLHNMELVDLTYASMSDDKKSEAIYKAFKDFCTEHHGNMSVEDYYDDDNEARPQIQFITFEQIVKYRPLLIELSKELSSKYHYPIVIEYKIYEQYTKGELINPIVYTAESGKIYSQWNVEYTARKWIEKTEDTRLSSIKFFFKNYPRLVEKVIADYCLGVSNWQHIETILDELVDDTSEIKELQKRIESKVDELKGEDKSVRA